MHAGIALMYVEGEIQGGCITGRTVLVIETTCELDPTSPDYSAAELQRVVSMARSRLGQELRSHGSRAIGKEQRRIAGSNRRSQIDCLTSPP